MRHSRRKTSRNGRDAAIFTAVDAWAYARYHPQWRLTRKLLKPYGVDRLHLALPFLADEKFFWRRIFDRNPDFTLFCDKLATKAWIARREPQAGLPETLWQGTDAREIPEALLKRRAFLKASHGWQMNFPVHTAQSREEVVAVGDAYMRERHGARKHQWGYFDVPPRLLLEECVGDPGPGIEIKYYTFGSVVEQFVLQRHGDPVTASRWLRQPDGSYSRDPHRTLISEHIDWKPLPDIALEGLEIAARLGAVCDHLRIDTMVADGKLYMGELTVYSGGGRAYGQGHLPDAPLNRSWDLRQSWFLSTPQPGWRGVYAAALRRALDARGAPP